MNSSNDDVFAAAIAEKLDQSAANLSLDLRKKLDQARYSAVATHASSQKNKDFVNSVQSQLAQSESLPADIERKLNQMRRRALTQKPQHSQNFLEKIQQSLSSFIPRTNFGTGMLATACLTLTVAALFYDGSVPRGEAPLDPELGLIASADELELYENLDFYLWLAENEELN